MEGEQIKKLRIKLGISQEKLAHLLGVTKLTVNRWENGKSKPSPLAIDSLERLKSERWSIYE